MGCKQFETRSWPTSYRGKLLICSAKKDGEDLHSTYLYLAEQCGIDTAKYPWKALLKGYAVAICDLVDCIKMTSDFTASQSKMELCCGDWSVGRYAWKLENVQSLEPISIKGHQGLWNVDSAIFEQIRILPVRPQPKRRHRLQGQASGWIERQPKRKQLANGTIATYEYFYYRWEQEGRCYGKRISDDLVETVTAAIATGSTVQEILALL